MRKHIETFVALGALLSIASWAWADPGLEGFAKPGLRGALRGEAARPAESLPQRAESLARGWHRRCVDAAYARLRAAAETPAQRAALRAAEARDAEFARVAVLEESAYWGLLVDEAYAQGRPYRDARGAPIPRAAISVWTLELVPEYAEGVLDLSFVLDRRTGRLLDRSPLSDRSAAPRQLSAAR